APAIVIFWIARRRFSWLSFHMAFVINPALTGYAGASHTGRAKPGLPVRSTKTDLWSWAKFRAEFREAVLPAGLQSSPEDWYFEQSRPAVPEPVPVLMPAERVQ